MNVIRNTIYVYCDDCLSYIIMGNKDRDFNYLFKNKVDVLNYEINGLTYEEYFSYKDKPSQCSFCKEKSLSFKTLVK